MPVDTYQVALVANTDTFSILKDKTNQTIVLVNTLPSAPSGPITRLGGTIDGSGIGVALAGATGDLYIITTSGGVAAGDFLDTGEPPSITGLLHARKTTGHANIFIEAGATSGETGGTSNAAVLTLRDIGGANNYVKIAALPDVQGVAGRLGTRESLVPFIIHTHMNDVADVEYQEAVRLERQSDADLGAAESQAGYISYRMLAGTAGGTYDHVRLVGKNIGNAEDTGVFEIWVASSGVATKQVLIDDVKTHIVATTESTSSATGALVANGGIAIAKSAFLAANLTVEGTQDSAHALDGVFTTAGGVGIAKQLHVGTDLNVGADLNVTTNTDIQGTHASTGSTNGAVTVAGGAGVAKKMYVGTTATMDALEMSGSVPLIGALHCPRGYMDGFIMSRDGSGGVTDSLGTANSLNVTAGECRDAVNGNTCVMSSETTKIISSAWAEGDDAGGFPSGITLTRLVSYRVFVIRGPNGDTDIGFDSSPIAANILTDAAVVDSVKWGAGTTFRQIQWIFFGDDPDNTSQGEIVAFYQSPHEADHIQFLRPITNGTHDASTTRTLRQLLGIPPNVMAKFVYKPRFTEGSSVNRYGIVSHTASADIAADSSFHNVRVSREGSAGNEGDQVHMVMFYMPVNSSRGFYDRWSSTSTNLTLNYTSHGFWWNRTDG